MSSRPVGSFLVGLLLILTACQDQLTSPDLPLSAAKGGKPEKPPTTCEGLPQDATAVNLLSPASDIGVGATVALRAEDQAGNPIPACALKWSSNNPGIATVSSDGVVLGVALGGPVTIKAQTSGRKPFSGTTSITVGPPVGSVEVTPTSGQVRLGESLAFAATVKDGEGNPLTGRLVTWSSSDETIATVGADGTVTAVAPGGPVAIAATAEGVAGSAAVTVLPLVATVDVSPGTAAVAVGQTLQLSVTAKDGNGVVVPGLETLFTSSDPAVASVSPTGLVTVRGTGAPVTLSATVEGVVGTATISSSVPAIQGLEIRQVLPDGEGGYFASAIIRSATTIAGKSFTPVEQPDGMVLRFNSKLEPQWAVQMAASNGPWVGQHGECCWITVSPSGSVYASGAYKTSASVVHMGGTQTFTSSAGNMEGVLVQLSSTGYLISWAHLTGGAFTEALGSSAVDEAGNLYIGGSFNGCCGAPGTAILTTSSGSSLIVNAIGYNTGVGFKLSPSGAILWAVRAGARDASFSALAYEPGSGQVVFTSLINSDNNQATLSAGNGGSTTIACPDGCLLIAGFNSSDGSYRWHTTVTQPTWAGIFVEGLRFQGGKLYALMGFTGGPLTLWSAGGGTSMVVNSYSNTALQNALLARYSAAGAIEAFLPFQTSGELQPFLQLDALPGNELGVPFAFSGTLSVAGGSYMASSVHEGLLVRLSSGLQVLKSTRLTGPTAADNGLRAAVADADGYLVVSGKAGAGSILNGSVIVGGGGFLTRLPPGAF